jgi:hypothetical protein
LTVLNGVTLNQALVSFGEPDVTERVIAADSMRWNLLVWRNGVASQDRYADQRLLMGSH